VYGCDICQDVCPWNRGIEKRRANEEPRGEPTVSLVDWLGSEPRDLARRYDRLYVPRNDGRYLKRNAIVALGNSGTAEHVHLLDGVDDEHATWARAHIEGRGE